MQGSHYEWVIDAALRLLCVLGLDRFGDFVSDQVVAPVRETCAQALGSLFLLVPGGPNTKDTNGVFPGILSVILKLLEHNEWEARHGAFLALKYLLAVRDDLLDEVLPQVFPAIMQGLSDPVDDVGAAAASALIPVAHALPRLLKSTELETIVIRLWQLLKEQDDLAAACNTFMGLLAAILSLPAAHACLMPQPLSQVMQQYLYSFGKTIQIFKFFLTMVERRLFRYYHVYGHFSAIQVQVYVKPRYKHCKL